MKLKTRSSQTIFDGNDDCCHDYYNDEKSFWPASRPAALGDWTALESR